MHILTNITIEDMKDLSVYTYYIYPSVIGKVVCTLRSHEKAEPIPLS